MSLFGILELYGMEPKNMMQLFQLLICIKSFHEVEKKSQLGAPEELNYAVMIISPFVRYIERIPTIKDLVKRLHDDITIMVNCGFFVSDSIPSGASFSRLITKLNESNILEDCH